MNIAKIIIAGLIMMFSLSSCDFVRSIVGKPTSAQIEAIRLEKEAREKATRDSLAAIKVVQDSIAAQAMAREKARLSYKHYYVITGSFQQMDNADKYASKLEKLGYEVTFFNFKTGFKAVGICGTDSLSEAFRKMNDLFNVDITPYDLWVYDTTTDLHE